MGNDEERHIEHNCKSHQSHEAFEMANVSPPDASTFGEQGDGECSDRRRGSMV